MCTSLQENQKYHKLATDSEYPSKVKLSRYTPWRHMGGEEV
jgi:hypothetical protein